MPCAAFLRMFHVLIFCLALGKSVAQASGCSGSYTTHVLLNCAYYAKFVWASLINISCHMTFYLNFDV